MKRLNPKIKKIYSQMRWTSSIWTTLMVVLFFFQVKAQIVGSNCSSPKLQQPDSSCTIVNHTISNNQSEYWISFIATSKRIQFKTELNSISPIISSIDLIDGGCNNINVMESDNSFSIGDSISFVNNLIIGQTYFIRLNIVSTYVSSFDACVLEKSIQNGVFIFTNQNGISQTCAWSDDTQNTVLPGDTIWGQMYHCDLNFCVTDTICVSLLISPSNIVPVNIADYQFVYVSGNPFNSLNYNANHTETCFTFSSIGETIVYAKEGYFPNSNSALFPYDNLYQNNGGSGVTWGWTGNCKYYMKLNVYDSTPPATSNTNGILCIDDTLTLSANSGTLISSVNVNGTNQFVTDATEWSTIFDSSGTYILNYSVDGICQPSNYSDTIIVVDSVLISVTVNECNQATFNMYTCMNFSLIQFNDGFSGFNSIYPTNGYATWTVDYSNISTPISWVLNCYQQTAPTLPTLNLVYTESQIIQPAIPASIFTDAPSHLCELSEGGISIIAPTGLQNISWISIPSTATFSGQGTTTIFPDSWSSSNTDITLLVTAKDSNGCLYSDSIVLELCCEPDTDGEEYFEGSYTDIGLHHISAQLPVGYYNGPTQQINIDLPTPGINSISTVYSNPTTLTQFIQDNPSIYDVQNSIISTQDWVFFNNDLIVDMDVNFNLCDFLRFAPGTSMIIQPNVTVTITRSTLAPKCHEMWGGIKMDSETQQLFLNDVTIVGAIDGVYSSNGGYFNVNNSRFVDNYHGIKVVDYPNYPTNSSVVSSYFGDVKNQPLLPPYQFENQPVAGIDVENIFLITIGSSEETGNLFHNHQKGIQSIRSSVTSLKNNFHNIRHIPSDPIQNEGDKYTAIYAVNGMSLLTPQQNFTLNVGGNWETRNNFLNCEFGVSSKKSMNLNAVNNFMKNCLLRGISAEENRLKTIIIDQNEINSLNANAWGIYVKNYSNGTALIRSNKINTYNSNFVNFNRFAAGIYIASVQPTVFQTTEISYNTVDNCLYGIWMINISKGVIFGNRVNINLSDNQINNLSQNFAPFRGILVQNSTKAQVTQNTINRTLGTGNGVINDNLQAIRLELSPGAWVKENVMMNTAVGFYAFGSSLGSRVECNKMHYTRNGFYLDNADLSDQGAPISNNYPNGLDAHNQWYNTFSDRTTGNCFLTNYFHSQNGILHSGPSSTLNFLWIDSIIPNSKNNCIQIKDTTNSLIYTNSDRERELEPIVVNSIQYDTLDYEQKHFLNLASYSRLDNDSNLLIMNVPDDSIYINYYVDQTIQNTPCKIVHDAQLAMADEDYSAAISINNQIIGTCNLYATNKSVQEIWSQRKLDSTDFSTLDSLNLMDIACLNPLEYGSGVYQARAMMDWDGFCVFLSKSNQQFQYKNDNIPKLSAVYPNPSNGEFQVESSDSIENISVYNSGGSLIKTISSPNQTKLDVFLSPGVYTLHITLTNGQIETHKVVII